MTTNKIAKMLCSNNLSWYVVFYADGNIKLQHETSLSNILVIGKPCEEYGIDRLMRCGARDMREAMEWLSD